MSVPRIITGSAVIILVLPELAKNHIDAKGRIWCSRGCMIF